MTGETITLAHGGGGVQMQELIRQELLPACAADLGRGLEDAVVLPGAGRLALSTDSYVVRPAVFPGGDLGRLAVCGTVNDLAMRGARPLYLTLGLIVEEGTALELLRTVMRSVAAACAETGVALVTGDFKVVERGSGDGIFANTAGVGVPQADPPPALSRAEPGDLLLLNGPLGQHGIAVLAARGDLPLLTPVHSDCAPLARLVEGMLHAGGTGVHSLHDPTRGGLAAALGELAEAAGVAVEIEEAALPRDPAVQGACELLGLDLLQVANEGKLVAAVTPGAAAATLEAMRRSPQGREASVIGRVVEGPPGRVMLCTCLGTRRIVERPSGELLPRIC